MLTDTELQHFWNGEKPSDSFDVAAKGLFMALARVSTLFRGKNIRVDVSLPVEDYGYGVTRIGWDGVGGFLKVQVDGDTWYPLSDVSGPKPWLMTPVALHSKALLDAALDEKELVAQHMSSITESLDWMEVKS